MGAGFLAVKSGFILFIKNYQFPLQINTLERERERERERTSIKSIHTNIRLFPINSLGFSKFLENGRNSNYLLETHFAELLSLMCFYYQPKNLNPGYKRDLFTKPVPNLKQNGKNKKAF